MVVHARLGQAVASADHRTHPPHPPPPQSSPHSSFSPFPEDLEQWPSSGPAAGQEHPGSPQENFFAPRGFWVRCWPHEGGHKVAFDASLGKKEGPVSEQKITRKAQSTMEKKNESIWANLEICRLSLSLAVSTCLYLSRSLPPTPLKPLFHDRPVFTCLLFAASSTSQSSASQIKKGHHKQPRNNPH